MYLVGNSINLVLNTAAAAGAGFVSQAQFTAELVKSAGRSWIQIPKIPLAPAHCGAVALVHQIELLGVEKFVPKSADFFKEDTYFKKGAYVLYSGALLAGTTAALYFGAPLVGIAALTPEAAAGVFALTAVAEIVMAAVAKFFSFVKNLWILNLSFASECHHVFGSKDVAEKLKALKEAHETYETAKKGLIPSDKEIGELKQKKENLVSEKTGLENSIATGKEEQDENITSEAEGMKNLKANKFFIEIFNEKKGNLEEVKRSLNDKEVASNDKEAKNEFSNLKAGVEKLIQFRAAIAEYNALPEKVKKCQKEIEEIEHEIKEKETLRDNELKKDSSKDINALVEASSEALTKAQSDLVLKKNAFVNAIDSKAWSTLNKFVKKHESLINDAYFVKTVATKTGFTNGEAKALFSKDSMLDVLKTEIVVVQTP